MGSRDTGISSLALSLLRAQSSRKQDTDLESRGTEIRRAQSSYSNSILLTVQLPNISMTSGSVALLVPLSVCLYTVGLGLSIRMKW